MLAWMFKTLYNVATPDQLRSFGQSMLDAANYKDEKQKKIDDAFKLVVDGVNALKNI